MRVLITGASGFIGGHLVQRLAETGCAVRALVRAPTPALAALGVEQVSGDLTRPASLVAPLRDVQTIFHLAALRDRWGTPAQAYRTVNVEGTQHLLAAAAQAGVERFVHCSSVGVARWPGRIDADETLPYTTPTSQVDYHQTKIEAEQAVLAAARNGMLPALVVRPVITYGPGDRTGMVTRLITLIAQGRFVTIGDGRNHVDLAYVDDVVAGMYLAAERGTVGRVYILSAPRPETMNEVLKLACAAVGKPGPKRTHVPLGLARFAAWGAEQLGLALRRQPPLTRDALATLTIDRGFSHARAQHELGYVPQVLLADGLRSTAEWLQRNGSLAE